MDQENTYVTQVFEDGQILTANDMNNIIAGIDENSKKIEDLDSLTNDINSIETTINNIEYDINGLSNRVPATPNEDGTYWLSASQPSNVYQWVKQSAIQIYSDPDNDGNIIISDEVVESPV